MVEQKQKQKQGQKRLYVGIAAAIIGILGYAPLLYQVTVNKTTYSLRYSWMFLGLLSAVLWLIFALANNLTPNIIGSIAVIIIVAYLLIAKLYFEMTGKSVKSDPVYSPPLMP